MNFSSNSSNLAESWVAKILFINIAFFLAQIASSNLWGIHLETYLGLIPIRIISEYSIWQIFTYMFLHSQTSFLHILFNMYLLWIFGLAIEEEWGGKTFLKYYLFAGLGAGLFILVLNIFQAPASLTIGASGAIYALLLAFGLIYPNAEILLFFVIPMKAKYAVIVFGSFEFFMTLSATGGNISHIGHLGGLLFGLFYFVLFKRQYLFPNSKNKANAARELIGELKKKVEEIKEKTDKHVREENIRNAAIIKEKKDRGKEKLLDSEEKFLAFLVNSVPEKNHKNICSKEDFSQSDPYCLSCEYFNVCLHRYTTGEDPLKK